jgi:Tfp pilus assembly protein PilN
MLRTNLSTKPFYNERSVHSGLALASILVLGLTIFNVTQIVILTRRQSALNTRTATAEARARELVSHANTVRRGLNPDELAHVSDAAHEANALIAERLFSWTDFLNRVETTLPDEVRVTQLRPSIDKDGTITISMSAVARRPEDIARFMENLEGTGSFTDVYSREESSTEEGLLQTSLEARYLPK